MIYCECPKLEEFAKQVAKYLRLTNYNALIEIELEAVLADGWCHGDEEEVFITINDNLPLEEKKLALAHEMVHALQLASGRLDCEKLTFDGRCYRGINYKEQPHEIEAYALEKEIYEYCK